MNKNRFALPSDFTNSKIAESDDGSDIDITAMLRTLWRGKFWIVFCALLGLAAGLYQTRYHTSPLYLANATLALEVAQERLVNFESVTGGFGGDDAAITTEIEVIRSRGMLTKLADELNLIDHPHFNAALRLDDPKTPIEAFRAGVEEWLVDRAWMTPPETFLPPSDARLRESIVTSLFGMIDVVQKEWSYVLVVSASSPDPVLSASLANTLSRLYIEDRLEVKFEKSRDATAWLSGRVADLQLDVEKSANALKTFLASADLVDEETLATLNLRLKDQRERLGEALALQLAAETRGQQLLNAQDGTFSDKATAAKDSALDGLLSRALSGEETAGRLFNVRYAQLIARNNELMLRNRDQASVLERSVKRQEAEIEQQSSELVRVEQLRREAEANRLIYEYFLTRLKETAVQEGLQQADARIISPAITPGGSFNPNGNRAELLGLVLGLLIGGGSILFREQLVTSIRIPEDLERITDLPIIGQIPRIPGRTRRATVNYILNKPNSAPIEAIRNLRTSLLLTNLEAPPQVIMVTSAVPGEGKSTISVALAQNYSGLGKKVLLIEGDIRRRTLTKFLEVSDKGTGLMEVLSGAVALKDAVQTPNRFRFDILLGNDTTANPADILSSKQFSQFVDDAREIYDVIIFDTPPLLVVSDARIVGQYADAILFAVLWNKTSQPQVVDAIRELSSVGLNVTGTVLSNIDPAGIKKFGYGDRYGAYDRRTGRGYYKN
jgi:capsular exopolysaccharide synthesis family protein